MPRAFDLDLLLAGIEPRVWRRLRVPGELALSDLHRVIQVLMEWDDRHLHVFEIAGREYGSPNEDNEDDEFADAARPNLAGDDEHVTLAEAMAEGKGQIEYVYDFGDEWRVKISVAAESTVPAVVRIECLDGEGAGPPEDSGGIPGYQKLLDDWRQKGKGKAGLFSWNVKTANTRLREEFQGEGLVAPGPVTPEEQLMQDLTLLLLFLGSWEERDGVHVAWKTMRFEVLDALGEAGLIVTNTHRKSVVLTDEGMKKAQAILHGVSESLRGLQR